MIGEVGSDDLIPLLLRMADTNEQAIQTEVIKATEKTINEKLVMALIRYMRNDRLVQDVERGVGRAMFGIYFCKRFHDREMHAR